MSLYRYVILRDMVGVTVGLMQFQAQTAGTKIAAKSRLPLEILPVRALLVSIPDQAVLDLGRLEKADQHHASLQWQGDTRWKLWDAAILAEDWPSGELYAAGVLAAQNHLARQELTRIAADYLRLPREDAFSAADFSAGPVLSLPL